MANVRGSSNVRNAICSGKHSLLPPKSPFPSVSPSYVDYLGKPAIGPQGLSKPREVHSHHYLSSSDSFIVEEQPSWLDELLDEPETPVHKGGHRRSSSDSFAYIDVTTSTMDYIAQDGSRCKNLMLMPSWGLQNFEHHKDLRHASFHTRSNSWGKPKHWEWDTPLIPMAHPSGLPSARDNIVVQSLGSSCVLQEAERVPSTGSEKQNPVESGLHDLKAPSGREDSSHAKPSVAETDPKRAKQQFAQRSRVRKLQYIADLERNVHGLQAEGSEISAQLEFINHQNFILSMENKSLKQRLESLAHEQLIKYLQQEVLEREIGRLRALFQQQKQRQQLQPSSGLRRAKSSDFDSHFSNLSLNQKATSSGRNPFSGSVEV